MFTRKESAVLLFLCMTLVAGAGARWYRRNKIPLPQPARKAVIFRDRAVDTLSNEMAAKAENALELEPVLVNQASSEMLERLPGVGPVIAQRIIAYRHQHGPFRSIEDLLKVKGIGNKTVKRLKPFIQLE